MSNQITSEKKCSFRGFKKNIVILSALMLGCSLFAGPVHASGDERYERHDRSREETKLYGVIEKMPENGFNGTWIINGKKVLVSDTTRIKEKHGRAAIGRYVKAEGVRNGDSLTAYEIEVERSRESRSDDRRGSSKFYGTVEAMPQSGLNGVWKIDGREVMVTRNTKIKEKYGRLEIGSSVEVEGSLSDNTFTAYEIEGKNRRR
ncbi:MAG: hypothetical protein D3903_13655 [Candidatus Electrothrix sp. GM3_4]|nr:hypothetical protein [Candidatus Electrothrix sp. GM3_4]